MAKLIYFVFLLLFAEAFALFTNIQTATYNSIPEQCVAQINPLPFIKIGLKYYVVENVTKVNWFEASHRCKALGGDLATIESDAEMTALSDYLLAHGQRSNFIWLDGTDLAAEGKFKYVSSGLPVSYTKWSPGQPDNYLGNEHCMHLWLHDNKFLMNDCVCNKTFFYICEMKSPQVISFTLW